MSDTVPVRNRLDVLAAIRESTTLADAAKRLSLDPKALRSLAYKMHMGAALLRFDGRSRDAHPGLVDMTGRELFGGALVVERRAGTQGNGNARWSCRFKACGHFALFLGIALRAAKRCPRCPTCHGKQSGGGVK